MLRRFGVVSIYDGRVNTILLFIFCNNWKLKVYPIRISCKIIKKKYLNFNEKKKYKCAFQWEISRNLQSL